MFTASTDAPILVTRETDGSFVLTATTGAGRYTDIAAVWHAIDELDDPLAYDLARAA